MSKRRACIGLAALAALFAAAGQAHACMALDYYRAWIHDALPSPRPRDTIVADAIEPAARAPTGEGPAA